MKNLFFLVAVFISAITFGQSSMTVSDTVVNAGTEYATLKVANSGSNVSVQIVATKISGTVAGTAVLQASNDGVNYVSIGADTLTLTNVTTNTHLWSVSANPYIYYRVKVTGSGTMVATIKGYLVRRD